MVSGTTGSWPPRRRRSKHSSWWRAPTGSPRRSAVTTSSDRGSSPASPFRSPISGRDASARRKAVLMTIRAVRGVHDILPGEGEKWRRVERIAREVFDSYGYEEIRLPIFERTELFARSIGEATDIVQKEMYTFQDRGGDSVTLRPEATAGLLRAYIEHGLFVHPKPIKLYTRSEEHTSELQSRLHLVCRLLLEKKKNIQ